MAVPNKRCVVTDGDMGMHTGVHGGSAGLSTGVDESIHAGVDGYVCRCR